MKQSRRLTKRRVRSQENTLGIAELLEGDLGQAWVHLNLVDGRDNLAVWKKGLECFDGEVGDSEGADFA